MEVKNKKRSNFDSTNKKKKQSRIHPEPSITPVAGKNTKTVAYFLLFLIFLLALLLRFAAVNKIFVGSSVIFPDFDVYYHLRLITYSVQNFPSFLWFDSYVNYPLGYNVGWMPFYDLAIAFITLLISSGSPTTHTIETVAAIFPVALGAITVIPIFFIGKELHDRKLGLLSAFLFAIMPAHITVSRLGLTDHHVAEVFLFTMVLLLLIISMKYNSLIFAVLAGIFIGGMVFTWSAAQIYIAIISMFFIIQYGVNLYRGKTSENLILIGAVTALTALIITVLLFLLHWIPLYQVLGIVTFFSAVILPGVLSNIMLKKRIHKLMYPVAIVFFGFLLAGSIMLFPQEFGIFDEAMKYLAGENVVGTIIETQPFAEDYFAFITTLYFSIPFGFTLFFALIGLFYYIVSELGYRFAPEKLLFLISGLVIILLTFNQVRFSYLMSIFVAFFAAYFINRMIFDENFVLNTKTIASFTFLILLIGLPTAYVAYALATETPEVAGDWRDALIWMRNNTPETSYYDNPRESPEYVVMAWADYGNWIEYVARRPVVANNFQAGIIAAAQYFTADSEKTANDILDQRRARYVIVDDETGFGFEDIVYGKYGHILDIAGKNMSNYYYSFDVPAPNSIVKTNLLNNNYYNTIFARLYLLDGSSIENPLNIRDEGLSHYRLVYESNTTGSNTINVKKIKIFEYVRGAMIRGTTSPNTILEIFVPVRTNTNRTFNYIVKTISDANGNFTLVVPYATEGTPYETGPINAYSMYINNVTVKNISISNKQILDGSLVDPGYMSNPGNRTGAIALTPEKPEKMDIIWKYDTGKKIYDIIIRNSIIYATSDKDLFALDINGSFLAWRQDIPTMPTPLEISEDTLYTAIRQGPLIKIFVRNLITDKTSLIKVPDVSASVSPVLVDGKDLYFGTGNTMNSYDLSGNALKWKFTASDTIVSKPASKDNMIYFTSYNGTVYALDRNDGALKWDHDVKTRIWSSPILINNIIYIGDISGNINALDARTGKSLWRYETGFSVDSPPTHLNNTLYAASYDGKVYALNASSGELVWKSEQLFPIYASPVVEKGSVFVGALDGKMYKLDKMDGKVTGICATNGTITASPVVRDGIVYVGSQDGGLYACKI
ncbi:MAG: oligosaccharyl transferase, archaeosortase A system-associated [Euryarchaeota archaeon]|nr:oligosaccharyl transferase, archaeosortase A system-associated [Euryarchaeota archaeon]